MSREEYPKQFIIKGNGHSLFQETIARNLPFCDEFIIATNEKYRYVVQSQMEVFQGIAWHAVYEKGGVGTAAAVVLASLSLPQSELLLIVNSDQLLLENEDGTEIADYQDAIIRARLLAKEGKNALLGLQDSQIESRYSWLRETDGRFEFVYCPSRTKLQRFGTEAPQYRYMGVAVVDNGVFQQHCRTRVSDFFGLVKQLFDQQKMYRAHLIDVSGLNRRYHGSLERIIFSRLLDFDVVPCRFQLREVDTLEDFAQNCSLQEGPVALAADIRKVQVLNDQSDQLVVVDGVDDVMVVNTGDVVYVGRNSKTTDLDHLAESQPHIRPFLKRGQIAYRTWGQYEELCSTPSYRVRKVQIFPGQCIYPP